MIGTPLMKYLWTFWSIAITNYVNKTAKEKVWDPLATWWRKRSYLQNATTSFEMAKDIRMFGLREWLKEKFLFLYLSPALQLFYYHLDNLPCVCYITITLCTA